MKIAIVFSLFLSCLSFATVISTNNVSIPKAPSWLSEDRVEKVTQKIQNALEWDIRRVNVIWYDDQKTFENVHGWGSAVLAFSRAADNTVHIGPKVTADNFDGVFGHELVHVIVRQKYKSAIPPWLEEGLANYTAKLGFVDYKWLAKQPQKDITTLTHPFAYAGDFRYHYLASTAVMEMIASKCSISDLLQLSVGKKLTTYLSTYCGITDLNADFKKWIEKKAK